MKKYIRVLPLMTAILIALTLYHNVGSLEGQLKEVRGQALELEKERDKYIKELTVKDLEIEKLNIYIDELLEEIEGLRTIRAKLTAYSPYDNVDGQQAMGDPSKTSIGKDVGKYIVAADPKKLPYGTILEIPDWGIVEVGDTGGALRSDNKNIRLDLYHDTHSEAMAFGVQDKEVKIIKWGGEQ